MRLRLPDVDPSRPHYESVYLTAWDPAGGRAIWIRHTVLRKAGGPAIGSVWVTVFDPERGPQALKQRFGGEELSGEGWVTIGGCRIDAAGLTGSIERDGRDARWSLQLEASAPAFDYLPRGWLYSAPVPRTKPSLPVPAATLGGELELDGERLEVRGWPGLVGHNWGSEHPHRGIWIHGAGFAEAPEVRLDVVAGRIKLGPVTTPWLANGALTVGGETIRLGGLAPAATRIDEAPTAARFVLRGRGVTVRGRVAAPAARFVGWRYTDPRTGRWHPTLNCSVADMELMVERRGSPALALHSDGRSAYELQLAERDHGLPLQPFGDP